MAAVDWFGSTVVEAPPAPRTRRRPSPAPAAAPARKARSGRRVRGGILWISVFAVLLAGIVALNVAVLRANIDMNKLDRQQTQLQEQNAALASQVSAAGASLRIESAARRSASCRRPRRTRATSTSAPARRECPSANARPLERDHAARCRVLSRARSFGYERSLRPCIAWCSRPEAHKHSPKGH